MRKAVESVIVVVSANVNGYEGAPTNFFKCDLLTTSQYRYNSRLDSWSLHP